MDARREPLPQSGGQVDLAYGDQHATAVEVGGALRTYATGERDVLDSYAVDEMCSGARGQSLIPWPNRLQDGRYTFDDEERQLSLTEPEKQNAIHGLVRWANWTVAERDRDRAVMEHLLHPQPGYPFALELSIEYRLSDEGLRVTTTATNVGAGACPYAAGAHPYLIVGTPTIDAVTVRAPGRVRLPTDERGIPTGAEPVDGTEYDFREPRMLGDTRLDTGYAELDRDGDGLARVELAAPGGVGATLWMDAGYPYLMLFTGDSLPEPERRRRSLGVEPMTCAPNAFRSGEGLRALEAGESFTASWGIMPSSAIQPVDPGPGTRTRL